MQDKQKNIVAFTNELEEIEDRVHAMSEHLKNVRQELTHTQVSCHHNSSMSSIIKAWQTISLNYW